MTDYTQIVISMHVGLVRSELATNTVTLKMVGITAMIPFNLGRNVSLGRQNRSYHKIPSHRILK